MPYFILSEPDEHRLWRVQRILLLMADLADATSKGSLTVNGEDLSALCHLLAETLPNAAELPFESGKSS